MIALINLLFRAVKGLFIMGGGEEAPVLNEF